jgi:hypothetical protein
LPPHNVFGLIELSLDALRRRHKRIVSHRRRFASIELQLGCVEHVNEAAIAITCILICGYFAGGRGTWIIRVTRKP